MNYKPREGVVFIKICDTFLLVPSLIISEVCPGVIRLSGFEALLWKQIENGAEYEKMLRITSKMTLQSSEKATILLDKTLKKLVDKGFLVTSCLLKILRTRTYIFVAKRIRSVAS